MILVIIKKYAKIIKIKVFFNKWRLDVMEDNDKNFEIEVASKRETESQIKEAERVEDTENRIGHTDNSNHGNQDLNHDNQYNQNNQYGNINGYQEVNEMEFMSSVNWIINIHKIFGILGIIQGVLASLSIVGVVTGIPMIIASMKLMDTSKILFNYKITREESNLKMFFDEYKKYWVILLVSMLISIILIIIGFLAFAGTIAALLGTFSGGHIGYEY